MSEFLFLCMSYAAKPQNQLILFIRMRFAAFRLACLINCSTPYAPCIDRDPSKKSTVRLFVAKVLGAPCL